ncbi:MAG TPA: Ig-like domain repeat protein [Terracidiphilus sp.]
MSWLLALGFAMATAASAQSAGTARACSASFASGDNVPAAAVSRVAGDWRTSTPVSLPASKPPALRDAVDLGLAPGSTRLDRMILLLEPSAAQGKALDAELDAMQSAGSCEYHHWLTARQFADRYANPAADVEAVAGWLRGEGFSVASLPASRGWIEFSGTAAQVTQAFHAPVHTWSTAGGTRLVLSNTIAVPAALSPVIHGLASLDGSKAAAAILAPQPLRTTAAALAAETDLGHAEALSPRLAAQALHLEGLPQGTGESIAIVARSNLHAEDIDAFRSSFGLTANPVRVSLAGPDPGLTSDQAAVELAASWTGVAAPGAGIVVAPAASTAATDGIDLSLASVVDQNLAHTMVVGYSACEAALSESHRAFYAALYRQAAAQGMSTVAATGDSGAAACQAAGVDVPVTTGFAVNALAVTPWNTAVGAAAFASASMSDVSAWSPVHTADPAYATGGGHSNTFSVPAWQAGLSGATNLRAVPDLSLPAAVDGAFSHGLAFCFSGSEKPAGCTLVRSGGSAAAAAIFAGVSAALAQQNGPQGNLAPRLYALRGQPGIFTDVEQGTARLACVEGTSGCDGPGTLGYDATAGYDLASGLGVPNAAALVGAWPDVGTATSVVSLTVSPTQANTTYNPSATITLTATVVATSGVGTPSGGLDFLDQATGANLNTSPVALGTDGKASLTVTGGMPKGGNSIVAKYSGDSTYAATDSQALTVNIQPSSTITTVMPATTTPAVGAAFSVKVTVAVNTPPAGTASPTGKITLNVDGLPYASADAAATSGTTSASFNVTINAGGSHNLQAVYAGDANYVASTASTVSVTVSKGATITTLTALPAILTAGVAETLTATIAAANGTGGTTTAFTGTVTFYDGTTQLGSANVNSGTATLPNVTLSASTTHVITAVYSGDDSWGSSTSNAVTLKASLIPTTITLSVTPATASPGQVVTMTAIVTPSSAPASAVEQNPTGNVVFYNGNTVLAIVALTASANSTSTAQLLFATLPAGTVTLTAVYVGDAVYAAATSNTITITVQDFTLTPGPDSPPSDLDIIKGTSGQFSFIVSGVGGFNAPIAITCAVPATDFMTCVPNVSSITPTGTVTFTVNTFLTGSQASARPKPSLWPRAASGTALAALLFFLLPVGRRVRIFTERGRRLLILLLLMGMLGVAGMGCSSVSGSATAGDGTPLGLTTLKVTAAANVDNTVFSHSAYINVNVLPPGSTGTVQPVLGAK